MAERPNLGVSQIPNLSSFRQGGTRGRGRGVISEQKSNDEIIQSTDNDAATSRLSAVDAGYLDDPFAKLLTTSELTRRLPLMNRGTYVRTTSIDRIVDTFLDSSDGRKQIISLGAGSDTRYFRLKMRRPDLDIAYHEIDFPSNTNLKTERLKAASQAVRKISGVEIDAEGNNSDYHLHAQDLRTLSKPLPHIDKTLPTLLISECCLIYLSPDDAEAVLTYFTNLFARLAIVIYEPIRPHDSFGRTMVRNLTTRGIHLQTLEKYAELDDQRQRLREHGLEARAIDIDTIWRTWVNPTEKERVDNLEWMDEVEEFVLLAKHYCISWGWRGLDDTKWHGLSA